ncbi:MAG: glycoside hydrolase family 95 protein [Bacteroidales bacterium]|nr:glycoside hydrolase family 95 protein [Bacteroidales bacterium]
MKRLLVLCALLSSACTRGQQLTLYYDRPAEFFEEALPIGNGRLGAMVYGNPREEKLSLNDITLWTGEPDRGPQHPDMVGRSYEGAVDAVREALWREDYQTAEWLQLGLQGHYSETYQPLGTLTIRYRGDAEITDYRRVLDLNTATVTVSYKRNGKAFRAEYFASAPDSVIVVHLKSEAPFSADVLFDSPQPHETVNGVTDGYVAWHAYPGYYSHEGPQFLYDPQRGIHFRTIVSETSLENCREATLYIVNSTSFAGFDKDPVKEGLPYQALADANMTRVRQLGYKAIRRRQKADYGKLFGRVRIDLGHTPDSVRCLPTDVQLRRYTDLEEANPSLEALYFQYGRYLLISSSRTPGVPANLQGLWNEHMDPPWSCNYTININLEENYWIAEVGALPEMHGVLLEFIDNLSRNGYSTARDMFGVSDGWCTGHNSDIWAMAQPVGLGDGHPSWANWNMGGVWLASHIWEHYLYTRNADELRRHYSALKGAAEFCLNWLVEYNGELITAPGTSPENLYVLDNGFIGSTLYGATADLAMIRECLADAAAAARVLGDDTFAERVENTLPRLRGWHKGPSGELLEWYHPWKDYDPRHRHQSHLYGLYPGHQILPGEEFADACARTLEIKGFETTGWSCGWRVNLYARLRDSENAYRMLRRLLRYVSPDGYQGPDARRGGGTYPNLMDAHSPFQIDGNFGGSAGIAEMLLYSTPEGYETLPALPEAWPRGYVRGLRSRDGSTVSFRWRNGRVAGR